MSCLIVFKPGDTLQWAGVVEHPTITDWTGYTVEAEIRRKNVDGTPGALVGTAVGSWLDESTGDFLLTVDDTSGWPTGVKLLIDVKFTSPGGSVMTSETAEFESKLRVTE